MDNQEIFNRANILFNTNAEQSVDLYKKFIETADNIEEKWYAYLQIGKGLLSLKQCDSALLWLLNAYNLIPNRAEPIYELSKYYREIGQHSTSHMFYNIGINIPRPPEHSKFIDKTTYEYLFDYEYSINAYYLGIDKQYALVNNIKLINKNPDINTMISTYNNLRFYIKPLDKTKAVTKIFTKKIGPHHTTSSSCIFRWPHNKSINNNNLLPTYGLNIRLVNYVINKDTRRYSFNGSPKILTRNLFIALDNDLNSIYEKEIISDMFDYLDYLGVEDLKVLPINNDLYYIGNVQCKDGKITLSHGKYDLENNKTVGSTIVSPLDKPTEKNWAMFEHNGDINIIYEWHPIKIGTIINNNLIINKIIDAPKIFSFLRGSSNGILYKNKLWFITHCTIDTGLRLYYHCIVVLDTVSYRVEKYSRLFQLEGEPIEYVLGFVIDDNKFIISYSLWDGECKIVTYPFDYIESLLVLYKQK